jgi:hypothetical protein
VYAVNSKIFFLALVLFLGGHLRLELSSIWVNKVIARYPHQTLSHILNKNSKKMEGGIANHIDNNLVLYCNN